MDRRSFVVVQKFKRSLHSSACRLIRFIEEFAQQFRNEGIDVVRIISFVLRAFLRVLNEAVARLPSGVSGIRRGGSTAQVAQVCKLCGRSSPSATIHDRVERVPFAAGARGVLMK